MPGPLNIHSLTFIWFVKINFTLQKWNVLLNSCNMLAPDTILSISKRRRSGVNVGDKAMFVTNQVTQYQIPHEMYLCFWLPDVAGMMKGSRVTSLGWLCRLIKIHLQWLLEVCTLLAVTSRWLVGDLRPCDVIGFGPVFQAKRPWNCDTTSSRDEFSHTIICNGRLC